MTIQYPYLFIEVRSYNAIAQMALSLQYFYFGLLSAGILGVYTPLCLVYCLQFSSLLCHTATQRCPIKICPAGQLINPQMGSHNNFLCQF